MADHALVEENQVLHGEMHPSILIDRSLGIYMKFVGVWLAICQSLKDYVVSIRALAMFSQIEDATRFVTFLAVDEMVQTGAV